MLYELEVRDVIIGADERWDWHTYKYVKTKAKLNKELLTSKHKDDTFIVVFSLEQKEQYDLFKKEYPCKILFESIKARNTNMGSKTQPRNTMIVFELNDNV